jgi:hypothetical protein
MYVSFEGTLAAKAWLARQELYLNGSEDEVFVYH